MKTSQSKPATPAKTSITKTAARRILKKYGAVPGMEFDAPKGQVPVYHGYYHEPRRGQYVHVTFDEKRQQFFYNRQPISEPDAALLWLYIATSDEFAGHGMDQGGIIFEIVASLVADAR